MSLASICRRLLGIAMANNSAAKEICDAIDYATTEVAAKTLVVPVAALTAGNDLAETIVGAFRAGAVIQSVAFLATGGFGTVDDSNTAVYRLRQGSNTIVTKTYNTATQPTASAVNDLGTPDATHKTVAADTPIKLTITNGATAATPAGYLIVQYTVPDA